MKNILTILLLLLSFNSISQTLELTDTINKRKLQIAILTELFIEEQCSNCNIIVNIIDDNNTIYLQCTNIQNVYCDNIDSRYTYSYTLKFIISNKQYKVTISDIKCISVYNNKNCKCIEYNSEYDISYSIDENSYNNLKLNLNKELQHILNKYVLYLNNN